MADWAHGARREAARRRDGTPPRQRRRRVIPRHVQERDVPPSQLRHPQGGATRISRVRRGIPRPPSPALHDRLPHPRRGDGRALRAHGRDGRERRGVATGGMIMGRSLSGGVETVQPSPTGAKARGGRRRGRVRPHGEAHPGPTPHEKAQSAAPTSHRMRFSVTSPPGRRGARPPASLRGTMESGPTGQTCSGNHPPGWRVVAPGPAGLGLGPGASRKSAVWAEGLADGAPCVRPQAAQASP